MNVRKRTGRIIYSVLAFIFLLCITVQIFLAGMAIFISPVHWMRHMTFIHLFGFNIPLFMLLFAFVGAMPRWAYWSVFSYFVSIFAMYFTGNMSAQLPWIAALHPVIATVLFIIALLVVNKSFKSVKEKGEK